MKIIRLTEKSVNKMYGIAEQISEAAEAFMECLDKVDMGNGYEDDEDWDQEEEDWDEDDSEDMDTGNRSGRGYRSGSGSMGNRGGSGYRSGARARRGDIANRRGVKGTGRYSRY